MPTAFSTGLAALFVINSLALSVAVGNGLGWLLDQVEIPGDMQ